MTAEDQFDSAQPNDSDEDVERRYQGLIDIYKDGRFVGETGDLRKLTIACFRLYNRVRSDPSQFSADDLVWIIEDGYTTMRWLDILLRTCDRELNHAD